MLLDDKCPAWRAGSANHPGTDTPLRDQCVSLMLKLTAGSDRKPISPALSAIMRRRAASIRQRLIKLPMPAIHNGQCGEYIFGRGELIASISNEAREQARFMSRRLPGQGDRDARLDELTKPMCGALRLQAENGAARPAAIEHLGLLQVKNSEIQRQQNAWRRQARFTALAEHQ